MMRPLVAAPLLCVIALVVAGCNSEAEITRSVPATVEVTREVPVEVEVEATRVVPVTVEVTRLAPASAEVSGGEGQAIPESRLKLVRERGRLICASRNDLPGWPVCRRPRMATQAKGQQGVKVPLHPGDGHQKVTPHVVPRPFHLSLVIALARAAKPVLKQRVGLKLSEGSGALRMTIAQDPGRHQSASGGSYRMLWGPPPRKAKAKTWPSRNTSVVSAG